MRMGRNDVCFLASSSSILIDAQNGGSRFKQDCRQIGHSPVPNGGRHLTIQSKETNRRVSGRSAGVLGVVINRTSQSFGGSRKSDPAAYWSLKMTAYGATHSLFTWSIFCLDCPATGASYTSAASTSRRTKACLAWSTRRFSGASMSTALTPTPSDRTSPSLLYGISRSAFTTGMSITFSEKCTSADSIRSMRRDGGWLVRQPGRAM